jgi:hypothetical protein
LQEAGGESPCSLREKLALSPTTDVALWMSLRARPPHLDISPSGPAPGRRTVRKRLYPFRLMSQLRGRARIGWELVRVLQESLMSLEATTSRVVAAQVAGAITLWTQLYTFEDGPPEVIAWVALFLFIGSISLLGLFIRPRRLVRFWDRAIPDEVFAAKLPMGPDDEASLIEHISIMMRRQRDQLERGISLSVPIGIVALMLVLIAYALDKRFYPP